jgi:hypothetical protein
MKTYGMSYAEADLTEQRAAALTARTTNHTDYCRCGSSCCSHEIANKEWQSAIWRLVEHVRSVSKAEINYNLCVALTQKHFGKKTSIREIAINCGIDRATAGKYNLMVINILKTIE